MSTAKKKIDIEPPTFWQLVFMQSRVNGGEYRGDEHRVHDRPWNWPTGTYLQRRLRELRESKER